MKPNYFNKKKIIQVFNRTAKTCQIAEMPHQEIGNRLLERLDFIKFNPGYILDIGASTGNLTQKLSLLYPRAHLIGLDIAKQRLFEAKNRTSLPYLCADIENLPLKHHSIDLAFSNLTLHWCNDIFLAFQQIRQALSADGLFLFSMFGLDTLAEISANWKSPEHEEHVYQFPDMHHVGDALLYAGFQNPVVDMEYITVEYPNLAHFLANLKKSGETYHANQGIKGLMGKNLFNEWVKSTKEVNGEEKTFSVTFEIIYGHALSKFKTG